VIAVSADDERQAVGPGYQLPARYGSRFFIEGVPDSKFPESGMSAPDAYQLIQEEMELDGDPGRNLATFVTTWMELPAKMIVAENLHRNFIDHAEYPRTAEIERRCIRMLGDLFNASAETTGARCQGSSEAIMLGGLAAKWRWRKARGAAGSDEAKPNLVYGADVHVVWDKFCRYFDVEPRIIPLRPGKYVIGPEDVEPLVDENTIGVVAVLGTTFTGQADDVAGIDELLRRIHSERDLDVPIHVDAASGGFVWPFLYPEEQWDFSLEQVRSINVSGHKFGMVYPGIGWLVFKESSDLPEDLVFYENYLGETDATFTLNFSTGASVMLAQYYNFCRFGKAGYAEIIGAMQKNAHYLGGQLAEGGLFELIGQDEPQLPLITFRLKGDDVGYDEFDVAGQLAAERGWLVPAYTLPPDAEDVTVMRALVKENVSHAAGQTLAEDIAHACKTLAKKGGLHKRDRKRVKTGTGY
jgi:glutamate decarboxylase